MIFFFRTLIKQGAPDPGRMAALSAFLGKVLHGCDLCFVWPSVGVEVEINNGRVMLQGLQAVLRRPNAGHRAVARAILQASDGATVATLVSVAPFALARLSVRLLVLRGDVFRLLSGLRARCDHSVCSISCLHVLRCVSFLATCFRVFWLAGSLSSRVAHSLSRSRSKG